MINCHVPEWCHNVTKSAELTEAAKPAPSGKDESQLNFKDGSGDGVAKVTAILAA